MTRLVYAQQLTTSFVPVFPAYAIMFRERGGLTSSQISVLFIICNVSAMVAEVPTGVLADRTSRRTVLLISSLLTASTFAMWLALPCFLGYAAGFILWGAGFAMSSGALQAYLFDELAALGRSDAFTKTFSRGRSLGYAGMFLSYGLAILIGIQRYEPLLLVSLVMCLLSVVVLLRFPKDAGAASIADRRGHLRTALRAARASPPLRRTVPTIAIVGGSLAIMSEYVPLYYAAIRVPLETIPYLLLTGVFLGTLVTWFAHRFEHRRAHWLLSLFLLAGLELFLSSFGDQQAAVLGMMGFMALLRMADVLFEAALQHQVDGSSRATLGSLPTFLNEVWGIGLAAGYGIVARLGGDIIAVRAASIAVAISALALTMWWQLLPARTSTPTVAIEPA